MYICAIKFRLSKNILKIIVRLSCKKINYAWKFIRKTCIKNFLSITEITETRYFKIKKNKVINLPDKVIKLSRLFF